MINKPGQLDGYGLTPLSQSQLLKCWLKPKRKGVASAQTVKQAEASCVLDIVMTVVIGDIFVEDNE